METLNYQKVASRSKTFFFFFEGDRSQGRQVDVKGVFPPLPGLVRGMDSTEVAYVAATVSFGISIDDLAIKTGRRNSNVIVVTHYRRSVYDKDNHLPFARFP